MPDQDQLIQPGLVVVRLKGGLGNQMFQYAAGRALALRRRVPLKLDLSYYRRRPQRRYWLHVLHVQEQFPSTLDAVLLRIASKCEFHFLARSIQALAPGLAFQRLREDDGRGPTPDELSQASGRVYLDGYWQKQAYFADAADLIRREFSFRDPPPPPDRALMEEMAAPSSVCLHVRRGDYATAAPGQSPHGTCPLEYYQRAMALLEERVPSPRYYVFSDDPDWARANVQPRFPSTYIPRIPDRPDHQDLRLMTSCRHFIIANSSFSWWGAWLGGATDKIVIAPAVWFLARDRSDYNPVPPDWLRI